MKGFTVGETKYEFHFDPINIRKLQLFRVNVRLDGKDTFRFHLQGSEAGFMITDKDRIPVEIAAFESELSDVILQEHQEGDAL